MSEFTLTKTRMRQGVWEGVITGAVTPPQVDVLHLDQPVPDVKLTEVDGRWLLQIPIPADAISDGVQTLVICDQISGEMIGNVSLIAGEAMGDDIRAEIDLLRAELDMLKRAFRRHCVETA